jgi:IS30 family transposase
MGPTGAQPDHGLGADKACASAWERGLNENTNGLIRDFFPKATDFSTIANAQVAKVERLLNARPRKSLGFRSPQEVFHSLAYS